MKYRPILFSGPMVLAILEDRKWQTRRVVKSFKHITPIDGIERDCIKDKDGFPSRLDMAPDNWDCCPYGQPGDKLWVRETCRAHEITTKEAKADTYGVMKRLGLETPPYGLDGVIYAADGAFREIENTPEASALWCELNAYRGKRGATVPPIHMPRWASRITLEITGVRVERLQDITEEDAKAEGVAPAWIDEDDNDTVHAAALPTYRRGFARLWREINGDPSWAANPWVWRIEFKNISAALRGKGE